MKDTRLSVMAEEALPARARVAAAIPQGRGWSVDNIVTSLFRRKRLLLGVFVTFAVISIGLAAFLPNQYQSRMKILVKNARADVVITPEATNSSNPVGEVTESQINSEIALLTSKDLLEQVVRQSGLDKQVKPGFFSKDVPPVESAILQLEKNLEIVPAKKSDIIEVSYSARSPEAAASVLKTLAALYFDKHLKLHRPPGTTAFFQNQTNQYNDQLRSAEATLADFQREHNFISLEQEKQLNLQKMSEVRARYLESVGAVKDTTERLRKLEQQLATVPARVPTQSRSLPNQYSLERLGTMLVELKNRRTQLLTKFRPEDRLVREVEQQINETSRALDEAKKSSSVEQSSDINPLRQTLDTEMARVRLDLAGQQARRDDLANQVQQYQDVLSRLDLASNQHADLERELKKVQDSYQLYSKKQEEARIADELDQNKITNVALAEMPVVSRAPVRPNRWLTLGLGLFLGLFVSLTAVFVAELMRDTVHTPRELESLAGVPVIAAIHHQALAAGKP
jgi:uncharacterized protein involved in exopolysaccharide biosynthesis